MDDMFGVRPTVRLRARGGSVLRIGEQGRRALAVPMLLSTWNRANALTKAVRNMRTHFGRAASRGSRSGMVRCVALDDLRAVCDYAAVSSQFRRSSQPPRQQPFSSDADGVFRQYGLRVHRGEPPGRIRPRVHGVVAVHIDTLTAFT